jgi:hypothetical protein
MVMPQAMPNRGIRSGFVLRFESFRLHHAMDVQGDDEIFLGRSGEDRCFGVGCMNRAKSIGCCSVERRIDGNFTA